MGRQTFAGIAGLPLPRRAVRVLKDRGIFAHSLVSIEHQQLAQRYVVRGLESGGSAGDVGRYVTFARDDGEPLEYLHPVEAIGVNGLHAVVISPAIVRVDMLRKGRTYELLITHHSLTATQDGSRPQLETAILFRGIHGRVELDLCGKDKAQAGNVAPTFYSLAGEAVAIPEKFLLVVRATTKGVNCVGCSHAHYLRKPRRAIGETRASDSTQQTDSSGETAVTTQALAS
ncbi:MAG TPA: hypothetical protein VH350_11235 [Candidatus Sulfotelmatobacter sp.]|jgi:hypothetical protein|nr:hypothetical protein [Candidatus Sulfotelmatobacter sp.]